MPQAYTEQGLSEEEAELARRAALAIASGSKGSTVTLTLKHVARALERSAADILWRWRSLPLRRKVEVVNEVAALLYLLGFDECTVVRNRSNRTRKIILTRKARR